jgi:molybdenum cofactor synthesis domain-containing protein
VVARLAVLTVSDAGAKGERADTSGDAAIAWGEARGYRIVERAVVADDTVEIVRTLLAWCDRDAADLVLTTGGTGLSPRDRTPEATRAVIERDAPGLVERLRAVEVERFPRAALSGAVAGVRHRTLVINLPGSTKGVGDALTALDPVIDHAIAIVRGEATDHSPRL